jgi:hypothetical protein
MVTRLRRLPSVLIVDRRHEWGQRLRQQIISDHVRVFVVQSSIRL